MRILTTVIFLLITGQLWSGPIKVLFLGHSQEHHNSRKNHKKLIPQFLRSGILMTYTEKLTDINSDTLAEYDALIMYANYAKCSPEQEKALISYVEAGGGFVPLHSASWCFSNSSAFTKLVGARFAGHKKAWFTTKIAAGKAEHPSLGGVKEFETWDETYFHKEFNPDRTDLQFRIEDGKKEPWTWVRTQGKGRVFYTAYGHDGPVWENVNFHKMVAAGTIWASGKKNVTSEKDFPEFKYVADKEGFLTNYEKRKVRHRRQLPVSPEESAKCNVLPKGFEAKLFVSEPDIVNPIDMAWDDKGRLFVAESLDYPNDMQKLGAGNDRIKICEDTNGDGRADKFTVFADKLSIPTSICFSDGGIIVAHAPVFLFLKDTDGDDKADVVKELNKGWGIGDTHAGPSNLNYGLDNSIYGAIGYSGGPNKVRSGLFRMKPDGSEVENITNFNNNTWGLGISEDFEVFGSTANRNPAFHAAIPYRYYEKAGVGKKPANLIFDSASFYPLIATRQVDAFGQYTAATGFNFYTARTYPEKYWNKAAFIGGPSGRLLGQFFIKPNGGSYSAVNSGNMLASFDQYTSPIQAKTGPDGQVWMLDWSNLIIQHNPTPSLARGGFQSHRGKGNAHWNPLRDKKHGRIYRIVYKDGNPSKQFDLSKADTKTLAAALKSDNMFWRITAQRKIVQEKRLDAVPLLITLAKDPSVDEAGLNPAVIHALWSMHGLGVLDGSNKAALEAVVTALGHQAASVRKNAVRVLPDSSESSDAILISGILKDRDLNSRRNAYLKVSEMPSSADIGKFLFTQQPEVKNDVWLYDSWKIAMSKHGSLEALISKMPLRDRIKELAEPQSNANNLLPNTSFEASKEDLPIGWHKKIYSGAAEVRIDNAVARTGKRSAYIKSDKGSDAGMKIFVDLPKGKYVLSGWVKLKGINTVGSAKGVMFNIEGAVSGSALSSTLKGTTSWRKLSFEFSVRNKGRYGINCLFGGWGQARGEAWFDDVSLVRKGAAAGVSSGAEIESILAAGFFKRHPDKIVSTVEILTGKESSVVEAVISELSDLKVKLPAEDIARLKKAASSFSSANKMHLAEFAKNNGFDLGVAAVQVNAWVPEILKGNASRGQKLAATCIGCHGADLNGDIGRKSPALASQHDWYLITQMQKYKHGLRGGDVSDANAIAMKDVTSKMTSGQIADVVAYIKKEFKGKAIKPTLKGGDVKRGKQLFVTCIACHGAEGQGNLQLKSPRLTGLSDWYIVESIKKFKSGERGSGKGDVQGKMMQSMMQVLADEQSMKDVAAYIMTLKNP